MLRLSKTMKKKIISLVFFLLSINFYGLQFGNGNNISTMKFIKIEDNVKLVKAEPLHYTYIIKNDNSLWFTGENYNYWFLKELPEEVNTFTKIYENVKDISHTFILFADNKLYDFYEDSILLDENVKQISWPYYIKIDNSLWCYGTRIRKIRDNILYVYNNSYETMIITDKHELYLNGSHYLPSKKYPKSPSEEFFKLAENVRYATDGFYITTKNELYAFGYAAEGALGVGNVTDDILPTKIMDNVELVVSNLHVSLILKKDGTLYGCGGRNPDYCGELGFGNLEPVLIPKKISEDVKTMAVGTCYTAYVKKDGTLWMCGTNEIPALQ